ncbi:unnamed protein product, partial [Gongylonema pulchrum]|uniref:Nucleotide exchange factor GrpE n=1 Tax=Gongylonema pulchrum TaxID=637853 RepID=A0A183DAY1_9BILA
MDTPKTANSESRLVDQLPENDVTLTEQINRQTREIEDEVRERQALVGEKEPMGNLLNSYDRLTSA